MKVNSRKVFSEGAAALESAEDLCLLGSDNEFERVIDSVTPSLVCVKEVEKRQVDVELNTAESHAFSASGLDLFVDSEQNYEHKREQQSFELNQFEGQGDAFPCSRRMLPIHTLESLLVKAESEEGCRTIAKKSINKIARYARDQSKLFYVPNKECTSISLKILAHIAKNKFSIPEEARIILFEMFTKLTSDPEKTLSLEEVKNLNYIMLAVGYILTNGQTFPSEMSSQERATEDLLNKGIANLKKGKDGYINTITVCRYAQIRSGSTLSADVLSDLQQALAYSFTTELPPKKTPANRGIFMFSSLWTLLIDGLYKAAFQEKHLSVANLTYMADHAWSKDAHYKTRFKVIHFILLAMRQGYLEAFTDIKSVDTVVVNALSSPDFDIRRLGMMAASYLFKIRGDGSNPEKPTDLEKSWLNAHSHRQNIALRTIEMAINLGPISEDARRELIPILTKCGTDKFGDEQSGLKKNRAKYLLARLGSEIQNFEELLLDPGNCIAAAGEILRLVKCEKELNSSIFEILLQLMEPLFPSGSHIKVPKKAYIISVLIFKEALKNKQKINTEFLNNLYNNCNKELGRISSTYNEAPEDTEDTEDTEGAKDAEDNIRLINAVILTLGELSQRTLEFDSRNVIEIFSMLVSKPDFFNSVMLSSIEIIKKEWGSSSPEFMKTLKCFCGILFTLLNKDEDKENIEITGSVLIFFFQLTSIGYFFEIEELNFFLNKFCNLNSSARNFDEKTNRIKANYLGILGECLKGREKICLKNNEHKNNEHMSSIISCYDSEDEVLSSDAESVLCLLLEKQECPLPLLSDKNLNKLLSLLPKAKYSHRVPKPLYLWAARQEGSVSKPGFDHVAQAISPESETLKNIFLFLLLLSRRQDIPNNVLGKILPSINPIGGENSNILVSILANMLRRDEISELKILLSNRKLHFGLLEIAQAGYAKRETREAALEILEKLSGNWEAEFSIDLFSKISSILNSAQMWIISGLLRIILNQLHVLEPDVNRGEEYAIQILNATKECLRTEKNCEVAIKILFNVPADKRNIDVKTASNMLNLLYSHPTPYVRAVVLEIFREEEVLLRKIFPQGTAGEYEFLRIKSAISLENNSMIYRTDKKVGEYLKVVETSVLDKKRLTKGVIEDLNSIIKSSKREEENYLILLKICKILIVSRQPASGELTHAVVENILQETKSEGEETNVTTALVLTTALINRVSVPEEAYQVLLNLLLSNSFDPSLIENFLRALLIAVNLGLAISEENLCKLHKLVFTLVETGILNTWHKLVLSVSEAMTSEASDPMKKYFIESTEYLLTNCIKAKDLIDFIPTIRRFANIKEIELMLTFREEELSGITGSDDNFISFLKRDLPNFSGWYLEETLEKIASFLYSQKHRESTASSVFLSLPKRAVTDKFLTEIIKCLNLAYIKRPLIDGVEKWINHLLYLKQTFSENHLSLFEDVLMTSNDLNSRNFSLSTLQKLNKYLNFSDRLVLLIEREGKLHWVSDDAKDIRLSVSNTDLILNKVLEKSSEAEIYLEILAKESRYLPRFLVNDVCLKLVESIKVDTLFNEEITVLCLGWVNETGLLEDSTKQDCYQHMSDHLKVCDAKNIIAESISLWRGLRPTDASNEEVINCFLNILNAFLVRGDIVCKKIYKQILLSLYEHLLSSNTEKVPTGLSQKLSNSILQSTDNVFQDFVILIKFRLLTKFKYCFDDQVDSDSNSSPLFCILTIPAERICESLKVLTIYFADNSCFTPDEIIQLKGAVKESETPDVATCSLQKMIIDQSENFHPISHYLQYLQDQITCDNEERDQKIKQLLQSFILSCTDKAYYIIYELKWGNDLIDLFNDILEKCDSEDFIGFLECILSHDISSDWLKQALTNIQVEKISVSGLKSIIFKYLVRHKIEELRKGHPNVLDMEQARLFGVRINSLYEEGWEFDELVSALDMVCCIPGPSKLIQEVLVIMDILFRFRRVCQESDFNTYLLIPLKELVSSDKVGSTKELSIKNNIVLLHESLIRNLLPYEVTPRTREKIRNEIKDNKFPDTVEGSDEVLNVRDVLNEELEFYERLTEQYSFVLQIEKEGTSFNIKTLRAGCLPEESKEILLARVFAYLRRSCEISLKYNPRPVQLLAVYLLLKGKRENVNIVSQVLTGEGKSLIIAMLAASKVLIHEEKVDIATSTSKLADDSCKLMKPFFDFLGISVSSNTNSDIGSAEKSCYKDDIVYGGLSEFQFDYLDQEFNHSKIKLGRKCSELIVDEVDSLLIDEGSKLAMLSSSIPGMEELISILDQIWIRLTQLDLNRRNLESGMPIEENPFPSLEHCEKPDRDIKEKLTTYVLEELIQNTKYKEGEASLPIKPIPEHLKGFAESQASKWVKSAMLAFYGYNLNTHYSIHKGAHGEDTITPNDYLNTGFVQEGSIWQNGLHQFLQIKHGLRVTPERLTTNYISNIAYVKRYGGNMTGLTGTVGSKNSRDLLNSIYKHEDSDRGVDYLIIPPFSEKKLLTFPMEVLREENDWVRSVERSATQEASQGRVVLVLCETQELAHKVCRRIRKETSDTKIYEYTDNLKDYPFFLENKFSGNSIIVSTNLSGRGTDIKLENEVVERGGLHVCVSFLPNNSRVELQAFGRAARKGEPGSAQLILSQSHLIPKLGYLCPVDRIITQRNKLEKTRIEEFIGSELIVITRRDRLFKLYLKFLKEVRKIKKRTPANDLVESVYRSTLVNYQEKALEEKWGLWLKEVNFNLTMTEADYFDKLFEKFANEARDEYENYTLIKNPAYYMQHASQLIKAGNKSYHMAWKECFVKKAIESYGAAVTLDSYFSYRADYQKIHAELKLPQEPDQESYNSQILERLKKIGKTLREQMSVEQGVFIAYMAIKKETVSIENRDRHEMQLAERVGVLNLLDKSIFGSIGIIEEIENRILVVQEQGVIHKSLSDTDEASHASEEVGLSYSVTFKHLDNYHDLVAQSEAHIVLSQIESVKAGKYSLFFNKERIDSAAGPKFSALKLLPKNRYLEYQQKKTDRTHRKESEINKTEENKRSLTFAGKNTTKIKKFLVGAGDIIHGIEEKLKLTETVNRINDLFLAYKELNMDDIRVCLSLSFDENKSFLYEIFSLLEKSKEKDCSYLLSLDKHSFPAIKAIGFENKFKVNIKRNIGEKIIDAKKVVQLTSRDIQCVNLKDEDPEEMHEFFSETLSSEEVKVIISSLRENPAPFNAVFKIKDVTQDDAEQIINITNGFLHVSFELLPWQEIKRVAYLNMRELDLAKLKVDLLTEENKENLLRKVSLPKARLVTKSENFSRLALRVGSSPAFIASLQDYMLPYIYTINKKSPFQWRSVTFLATLSVCQAVGGGLLMLLTGGLAAEIGLNMLINTVGDIVQTISVALGQTFSLPAYLVNKSISYALSLGMAGVSHFIASTIGSASVDAIVAAEEVAIVVSSSDKIRTVAFASSGTAIKQVSKTVTNKVTQKIVQLSVEGAKRTSECLVSAGVDSLGKKIKIGLSRAVAENMQKWVHGVFSSDYVRKKLRIIFALAELNEGLASKRYLKLEIDKIIGALPHNLRELSVWDSYPCAQFEKKLLEYLDRYCSKNGSLKSVLSEYVSLYPNVNFTKLPKHESQKTSIRDRNLDIYMTWLGRAGLFTGGEFSRLNLFNMCWAVESERGNEYPLKGWTNVDNYNLDLIKAPRVGGLIDRNKKSIISACLHYCSAIKSSHVREFNDLAVYIINKLTVRGERPLLAVVDITKIIATKAITALINVGASSVISGVGSRPLAHNTQKNGAPKGLPSVTEPGTGQVTSRSLGEGVETSVVVNTPAGSNLAYSVRRGGPNFSHVNSSHDSLSLFSSEVSRTNFVITGLIAHPIQAVVNLATYGIGRAIRENERKKAEKLVQKLKEIIIDHIKSSRSLIPDCIRLNLRSIFMRVVVMIVEKVATGMTLSLGKWGSINRIIFETDILAPAQELCKNCIVGFEGSVRTKKICEFFEKLFPEDSSISKEDLETINRIYHNEKIRGKKMSREERDEMEEQMRVELAADDSTALAVNRAETNAAPLHIPIGHVSSIISSSTAGVSSIVRAGRDIALAFMHTKTRGKMLKNQLVLGLVSAQRDVRDEMLKLREELLKSQPEFATLIEKTFKSANQNFKVHGEQLQTLNSNFASNMNEINESMKYCNELDEKFRKIEIFYGNRKEKLQIQRDKTENRHTKKEINGDIARIPGLIVHDKKYAANNIYRGFKGLDSSTDYFKERLHSDVKNLSNRFDQIKELWIKGLEFIDKSREDSAEINRRFIEIYEDCNGKYGKLLGSVLNGSVDFANAIKRDIETGKKMIENAQKPSVSTGNRIPARSASIEGPGIAEEELRNVESLSPNRRVVTESKEEPSEEDTREQVYEHSNSSENSSSSESEGTEEECPAVLAAVPVPKVSSVPGGSVLLIAPTKGREVTEEETSNVGRSALDPAVTTESKSERPEEDTREQVDHRSNLSENTFLPELEGSEEEAPAVLVPAGPEQEAPKACLTACLNGCMLSF